MFSKQHNLILNTDSYKSSHYLQYPPDTEYVSSYIESRGGEFEYGLFFGLQAFVKDYLSVPINLAMIDQAESLLTAHGVPFNRAGWLHILEQHQGYLPLRIEAVPEGSLVANKNILVQVVNTDPTCAWLTSYIETALLRAIWYPTTVATHSRACKQVLKKYLDLTADSSEGLAFKLHDFGARGVSSEESAALGGLAHLLNFMGTDTLSAILAAQQFYNATEMPAFSIPAAEHSTITAWGKDGELQAYENMLTQFAGENRLLAVVSDSYDMWAAIDDMWGDSLKQQVINNGGTLVIRPDSGDPIEIVEQTVERLMIKFGHSVNQKGYRILPDYIRVIQGDGVSLKTIELILQRLESVGISTDNVGFGMGAELLQKCNRDTLKFAMKASAIYRQGAWHDVYKQPVTDLGKSSKKGRLALIKNQQGEYQTILVNQLGDQQNQLELVYQDGRLWRDESLQTLRERAAL